MLDTRFVASTVPHAVCGRRAGAKIVGISGENLLELVSGEVLPFDLKEKVIDVGEWNEANARWSLAYYRFKKPPKKGYLFLISGRRVRAGPLFNSGLLWRQKKTS